MSVPSFPNQTIVIVGAGYCGAMTAVNILRSYSGRMLKLLLVDRNTRPGRGLAYRTWNDNFVLNVPAGNMSALADEPDHFVQYCQAIDPAFNSGSFISRRIYGDYLEWTLQQAAENNKRVSLHYLHGDVLAVRGCGDSSGYIVSMGDGSSIQVDQVVLALGHFAPMSPAPTCDFYEHRAYIANPWNAALDGIQGEAPVALLGAGHTAIDALFRLSSNNDMRKIYLISRRGLGLQPHRSHPHSPTVGSFPAFLEGVPPTARAYCRALRSEIDKAAREGIDWRDVINGLRPHTPEIWRMLSSRERERFLSQLVAYWDIHRHRLAPAAHLRLGGMLKSGQVEAVAGYVQGYKIDGDVVDISLRERRTGRLRTLSVAAVVNCTGPSYDIYKLKSPLITQLRDEGYLLQDINRLGIEVNDCYQVLDSRGVAAGKLFYIGPMLRACYWEATAVPELRAHTRRLAQILSV